MKGFILGLLISASFLFVIITMAVSDPNPSTQADLINADGSSKEVEVNEFSNNSSEEEIDLSYLDRIEKGDTLFASEYFKLAAVEYQFAAELQPDKSEPFQKMGLAYFNESDYANAVLNLTLAVEKDSADLESQILLGQALILVENYDQARTHFNALTLEATVIDYYRGVLSAYFADYEGATYQFNRVIDNGDDATLSQYAASFLASMTEFSLAEDGRESYRQTLIARSLSESGEMGMAIDLLFDVLAEEEDYRDAWIILGYSYLNLEQYVEAQEALFKAVELDPTKAESRYFLGLSYFGLDDYKAAITQIELAIQSGFEPQVQAYQKLADVSVLDGQYQKAVEAYEKVLVLNSSDVELYIRPIWLYLEHLNNIERAIELSKKAVTDYPNEPLSYSLLGWAKTVAGHYPEAEQNLNYALILDPEFPSAHLNFGRFHEVQGNIEKAKYHYKQAYTLSYGDSVGNLAADLYNKLVEREQQAPATAEAPPTDPATNPAQ